MEFVLENFEGKEIDGFYVQSLMRRVWAAQVEVLKEIDKICKRHNLKYIAQWGTLLGAIRHKGFIPWDDDIDLAMLREDYEKFIHYARKELPKGWLLYDCREAEFDDLLVRVINSYEINLQREFLERFRGCPFVIGVDIFPMDNIPDDPEEEETLINMMSMLDYVGVHWKDYENDPEGVEPVLQELEEVTGITFDRTKDLQKQVLNLADRASAMYYDEPTENVAMVYRLAEHPSNKFPRKYFDDIIRVPFEDTTVPVVREYDLMLRKYLGDDYMSPRIWASHDYPFFKSQIKNLRDAFKEYDAELPSCFDMYSRVDGKPLVSVIIPCYNVEKYIGRCLASLMCQTVSATSIEIICVDDASTDGTLAVLEEWGRKLGNILKVIHLESNGKQGTARNVGLEYAEADYVAFIDGDDWVEKDYIERLYEPTKMADFDVVTCALKRDPSEERTYFTDRATGKGSRSLVIDSPEKRKTFLNIYACGNSVCHKLIKKELLLDNEIYFPEQVAYEDAYFETLLHFYASKVYVHEEYLYHYYVNETSTVLTQHAEHHTDWLTVHMMKWQTWIDRGFLNDYREELEYEFLWSGFLGFLKLLAYRYEQPPYSLFLLAKEITLANVPDYSSNKYFANGFSEFQKILLETLALPVSREDFLQVTEMIKQHGV